VIRYCRTDSSDVVLMAGLPLPAPRTSLNQLDGLLMVKLPFKEDMRVLTAFRTFNDPSKTHVRTHSAHGGYCPCHVGVLTRAHAGVLLRVNNPQS
jgi:hypothetical protein